MRDEDREGEQSERVGSTVPTELQLLQPDLPKNDANPNISLLSLHYTHQPHDWHFPTPFNDNTKHITHRSGTTKPTHSPRERNYAAPHTTTRTHSTAAHRTGLEPISTHLPSSSPPSAAGNAWTQAHHDSHLTTTRATQSRGDAVRGCAASHTIHTTFLSPPHRRKWCAVREENDGRLDGRPGIKSTEFSHARATHTHRDALLKCVVYPTLCRVGTRCYVAKHASPHRCPTPSHHPPHHLASAHNNNENNTTAP